MKKMKKKFYIKFKNFLCIILDGKQIIKVENNY